MMPIAEEGPVTIHCAAERWVPLHAFARRRRFAAPRLMNTGLDREFRRSD